MAGTCTLYAHRNKGPRFSGHKELIAYFECTDGQQLEGAVLNAQKVLITGDTSGTISNVTAPSGDTTPAILDLNQYENVTLYAYNGGNDEVLTLSIFTAPVQSTEANRIAAYQNMTDGLDAGSRPYGWGLEGAAFTIAAGETCAPQKISSTGGLIAVTGQATTNGPYDAGETIKVWLVGERA